MATVMQQVDPVLLGNKDPGIRHELSELLVERPSGRLAHDGYDSAGEGLAHPTYANHLRSQTTMRTLILAAVMIGLCSPIGCKKAKYKQLGYGSFRQFQSAGGKFIVQMPGRPKEELVTEAGEEVVTYRVEEPDGIYIVAYTDEQIPADESASQIRSRIDGAFKQSLHNIGATLTSESDITLAGKYSGREFKAKLSQANKVQHTRIYIVDGRVYRLIVFGTQGWVSSPETFTFFDSFAVTP